MTPSRDRANHAGRGVTPRPVSFCGCNQDGITRWSNGENAGLSIRRWGFDSPTGDSRTNGIEVLRRHSRLLTDEVEVRILPVPLNVLVA